MKNCRDCIHYDLCLQMEFNGISMIMPEQCGLYEEKHLFVNIPCAIGTHLWKVTYPYREEPKVTEFIVKNIRTVGKKHAVQLEVQAVNVPGTNWMNYSKFHTSKEAAEEELRTKYLSVVTTVIHQDNAENDPNERKYLAVSIKHTANEWTFGMPCVLWGYKRTQDNEKRCFADYTLYPNKAELYSMQDWSDKGYGSIIKTDEAVHIEPGLCKKWKNYDSVLIDVEEYIGYCEMACLPLNSPEQQEK